MATIAMPIDVEVNLLRRLRAEFEELPGICLTFKQIERLLCVDPARCAEALQTLMAEGFLTRSGPVYMKNDRRR